MIQTDSSGELALIRYLLESIYRLDFFPRISNAQMLSGFPRQTLSSANKEKLPVFIQLKNARINMRQSIRL